MKIYVPVIEPATDLSLFATCVTAQELTVQVGTVLHCKFEPQVVVPEPDHPGLHVTVTVASMKPVKESVAALLEFDTCVDGQLSRILQLVSSLGIDEYAD